ncbi:MAG: ethylbenzene dehydrogenase-related protein [Thaumarchaeota archaeon]|nr:ethylbenzene dehydrogenase-related protein [Nitrososphaerota archaeon]
MAESGRLIRLRTLVLVVFLSTLTVSARFPYTVVAQTNFQNITSYTVTGAANFTAPGSESFWRSIPWTAIPLAASVSPGGGHTSELLVKSANDGFEIYVLFRWNDTQGPSYASDTEVYRASNGSLVPLNPGATANVKQLFYNSTYFYPDRAAMLWFIGNSSSRQQSPVMQLGSNGAITGGAADIWHWQSNPTDNSKTDAGFPGGYTDPAGKPSYPSDNLSFAEDDYTNTTGFFVTAGSFGNSSNLAPNANPFVVLAGTQYSSTNKTWTVEMTRSFTTDAPTFRVQLSSNSNYFVAFAVWQGKLGESSHFKSVSQWYELTISNQSPKSSSVPQPATGVTPLLAVVVAVGAFLVGVVVGSVLLSYRKDPRRPVP